MARKRDSGWFWITLAAIGGIVILSGMALRISGKLGGPGYDLYDIPSNSMFPNVRPGDYILAFANLYRNEVPPRGQVVVFKYPPDGKTDYIKRVIGLPGDRIQLRAGRLYINDQLVPRERTPDIAAPDGHRYIIYRETLPGGASYLIAEESDEQELDNTEVFTVPDGSVFLLGDNRDHSSDSRIKVTVGYVPLDLLRDKPVIVYWSKDLKRIGTEIR